MGARVVAALGCAAVVVGLAAGTVLAASKDVAIGGFAYSPGTLRVVVGDKVTWTNSDGPNHTATADDGSFDTGPISNGASATVTFATAGTFAYHCSIHPTMTATLVVAAAGSGPTTPATDTVGPPLAVTAIQIGLVTAIVLGGTWLVGFAAIRRRAERS